MSSSFLLTTAALSENPDLVQDFGVSKHRRVIRKSWLLPEGVWHLLLLNKSVQGWLIPYESLDFRNQRKVSDPKKLFSLNALLGLIPLSVLTIPAGDDKNLVLRLDGAEGGKAEPFLNEVRRRRARMLKELYLPFLAPTDQEEIKKLEWLKREEAITGEEFKELAVRTIA